MQFDAATSATPGTTAQPAKEKNDAMEINKEAVWKSEFRQTLAEIRDKGFGAYAEEVRAEKLAEMREEILAAMGLDEESLAKLSPEQRDVIERAVSQQIQKRLAAERALEVDDPLRAAAVDGAAAVNDQSAVGPNYGAGLVLLQVIEAADQADAISGKSDKEG
ncbi:MAG: hypothetical protein HN377_03640 [Alphaproteobacteria bacterium]|jgi:hypothetical protein|nr:hypothetical protein [Alphaproteobacteria bacterium]